jgi:hypothetical protein
MEVHAHSHTARKKWTHYFWEFLMLFLAVFCGFLAEYQLEHKIEKDREKQFIRSLLADLGEDTITLATAVTYMDSNVKRMDTLIRLLNSSGIKDHGSDLYYLGRRASRSQWLTINDRTIQQMKNSGGFRLIRNQRASSAIIDYYNLLTFIQMLQNIELSEQGEYRKLAIDLFHPLIFDGIVLPDNNIKRPEGNPSLLSYDPQLLLRISGMISYMKNSRLGLAGAEVEMKTAAEKLISLLKKEYHME